MSIHHWVEGGGGSQLSQIENRNQRSNRAIVVQHDNKAKYQAII
jgi:hypothetical protein